MKNIKHYSVPHLLHIETTYKCNSKCIFCYNPNRKSKINYKILDKIVEKVWKEQIPHVYLIGGEPSLLNIEKLNEYIEMLSEVSSVTIVTNGIKYLKNLSKNLACIGIPVHGTKETHEFVTKVKAFDKSVSSIRRYVDQGFDVRCIPVLMSINYDQIYQIIEFADKLKMSNVFIDRFESGGIGSKLMEKLKPSNEQFKESITQIIKAKNDFEIPIGFGTAIPWCIDERLIEEELISDCGVGITFAAINPKGDLRICNQSPIVYGNILNESIGEIWNKKSINDYRNLEWITEPCRSCTLVYDCICGCKVDVSFTKKYCVDYAVRDMKESPFKNFKPKIDRDFNLDYPKKNRIFEISPYSKLNLIHKEKYIVTRYQTVELDKTALKMYMDIKNGINNETELINKYSNIIDIENIRKFVSKLVFIDSIRVKGLDT